MTDAYTWTLTEYGYEVDGFPGDVEQHIDQAIDWRKHTHGGEITWETVAYRLFKNEIRLDTAAGTITVTRSTTAPVKRVVHSLLILTPVFLILYVTAPTVLLTPVPIGYFGVGGFLALTADNPVDLEPVATPAAKRTESSIYLCIAAAILLSLLPITAFTAVTRLPLILVTGVALAFLILIYNTTEPITPHLHADSVDPFSYILLTGLLLPGISIIAIAPFMAVTDLTPFYAVQEAVLTASPTLQQHVILTGSLILTAAVLGWMILHREHRWPLIPFLLGVIVLHHINYSIAYLYFAFPLILVLLVVMAIRDTIGAASDRVTEIQTLDISPFQSPWSRYAFGMGYLATSLACAALILELGTYTVLVNTQFNPAPFPLLEQRIFTAMDLLTIFFQPWPVFDPETYRAGYLLLASSPVLWLCGAWIHHIGAVNIGKHRILQETTASPYTSDVLPATIELRMLPGTVPDARPVTRFLGAQQYIIIGEPLFDELNDAELDAIIAHEVHHLRNRDFAAEFIATVLALFVGGKNALLVFYNYPRVEQDADRYAADTVGPQPLITALRTTDLLWTRAVHSGGPSLAHVYPGFTSVPTTWGRGIREDLTMMYDVLFGTVLLDAAHRDVEDRIDWLYAISDESKE